MKRFVEIIKKINGEHLFIAFVIAFFIMMRLNPAPWLPFDLRQW